MRLSLLAAVSRCCHQVLYRHTAHAARHRLLRTKPPLPTANLVDRSRTLYHLTSPPCLNIVPCAPYSKKSSDISLSNPLIREYLQDLVVKNEQNLQQYDERESVLTHLMKEFSAKEEELEETRAMAEGESQHKCSLMSRMKSHNFVY